MAFAIYHPRPRILQAFVLCSITVLGLFLLHEQYITPKVFSDVHLIPKYRPAVPRIAKLTMLYGEPSLTYQRAIASHERHAALHGYPVHILRKEIQTGYWNKPAYVMATLLRELEKDPGDRVEWLMWFDADSIVMNPELPAEVFLPSLHHGRHFQETHLLVTKDINGLNTGVCFIRVHEWSVRFIAKSMTYAMYNPDVDLGHSADQRAMEILINETDFRNHTTFIPKAWINAYTNDIEHGSLLVHFPGLLERDWHMRYWLNRAEGPEAKDWRMPLEATSFARQSTEFWDRLEDCRKVGEACVEQLKTARWVSNETRDTLEFYKDTCWYQSDSKEALANATERLDLAMHLLE